MNQKLTEPINPLLKTTGAYPAIGVLICPSKLNSVTDFVSASGKRSRRYAILMSLSGIPNLHEQPEPIMVKNDLQHIIIDADSIEDLRSRCYLEIDGIIGQMESILEEMKNEKNSKKIT